MKYRPITRADVRGIERGRVPRKKRHPSDAIVFAYVVAILAGFMLAFLAAGCAHGSTRGVAAVTPVAASESATPVRGPILIRVSIVDTDPSDDRVLSFVFVCSRIVELMRGEPVQS